MKNLYKTLRILQGTVSVAKVILILLYLNTIVFNEITPNNKNQIVVGALSEHLHLTLKACIYSPYNPEEDWWSEIGYADVDTLKQHTQLVLQELNNSASFIEYKAKNNFDDLY